MMLARLVDVKRFMVLVLFVFSSGVVARAEVYGYHPSSPISLGAGFDPKNPMRAFLPCVSSDGPIALDSTGAVKTVFVSTLVHSRRELYEHLGVSVQLSGHYGFFSGAGSSSFDREYGFSSDSLVWIVRASTDLGRFGLKSPVLVREAQAFLDAKNFNGFRQRCGTDVVLSERRGALIAAIFSVNNLSTFEKTRLEQSFSAGASGGIWGASVSASYSSFVSQAAKVSQINTNVVAVGGKGIQDLKDLFVGYDKLEDVSKTLQNYASGITPTNAPPLEYITGSFESFGALNANNPAVAYRDQVLGNLFMMNRDAQLTAERLNTIIKADPSSDLRSIVDEQQLSEYRSLLQGNRRFMNEIYQVAKACVVDDTKCDDSKLMEPAQVKWPNYGNSVPNLDNVRCTKTAQDTNLIQKRIDLKVDGSVTGTKIKRIEFVLNGQVVKQMSGSELKDGDTSVALSEVVWKSIGANDSASLIIKVTDRFDRVFSRILAQ